MIFEDYIHFNVELFYVLFLFYLLLHICLQIKFLALSYDDLYAPSN